jgi:arabinogalactan endo-1,4-beta-galactosidase
VSFAQPPSTAAVTTANQSLQFTADLAVNTAAILARPLSNLPAHPDGVTLVIQATGRAFMLAVGVKEADESHYNIELHLNPNDPPRTVQLDFRWLSLDENSSDENGQLDLDQAVEIHLLDITSILGPTGPGMVSLSSVEFWQGTPPPPVTKCASAGPGSEEFLTGVDDSYVQMGAQTGVQWYDADGQVVDPLALFHANGVKALRLRVWVRDEGESSLLEAAALAEHAYRQGLQVYPVLFLTDGWADVNGQPRPEQWEGLPLQQQAEAIRTYSQATVHRLLETGITPPYYEIGNEIDFGISGIYAGVGQRDLATLQTEYWPSAATLIQAAVEGVHQADPEARIMLHIAQSWDPVFATAFFTTMREQGVDFDIAGLSFYPPAFGVLVYVDFCQTLDRLYTDLGLPIVIAEYAYTAEPAVSGLFGAWRDFLPGYPISPEGQAAFVADFNADLRQHPAVIGSYYFSPSFYWYEVSNDDQLWGPFALFDTAGRARPAVQMFAQP